MVSSNGRTGLWQARRAALLLSAAVSAIAANGKASAQDAPAQAVPSASGEDASAAPVGEITVTGTRIRQEGYDAPVPVSVLGAADIEAQKPANIAELVYTLPAVTSSITAQTSSGSLSTGRAGVNTINLRSLGTSRTLVLLNGQRTVASTFDGLIDVNTFPQDLIKRVEVVTGGASAQYGSDAVGGVVNFILDDEFQGLRLGADTSISTYGDGHNYRLSGTAGFSLLDDRLHILLNGEYFHQDIINTVDRPWNKSGYQIIANPAYNPSNGQPELIVGPGVGSSNRALGGLIVSGPLMGTYFRGDGVTGQLNYGAVSGPWMIGGDWQITNEGAVGTNSLQPEEERIGIFNRIAFDVTPDITLYGQFSWNRWEGRQHYGSSGSSFTILADNAFLLTQYPQVSAAMQANGLNSITVGAWTPYFNGSHNSREVFRYVAGAKGELSLFNRPWSWDVYYHHGVTKTHEETVNSQRSERLTLARDAVLSASRIVCRSTLTDPTNGCVPLDVLGTGGNSAESLAYIFGPEQPFRKQTITLDIAAASIGGQLFDLPGGPVAVALGGEWREEQVNGEVGATSSSGWFDGGNYRVNSGKINVKEIFAEISLPVFEGLDVNAAGRYTDYSTSGSVGTWKVGATYSPVRGVKFRGAYSRDIRAPNMSELYLTGSTALQSYIFPTNSPVPGPQTIFTSTRGNPDLKPEKARTWTAGVVVTPSFLPGFSASVDYWDINLKDAIGTVGRQQIVDFCYGGFGQFCDNIVISNGQLQTVLLQPVNFASQHVSGLDIEASYRTQLSAISSDLPGNFSIHAAFTHYIKSVADNLVFPVDNAGVIQTPGSTSSGTPSWMYRVSAFYEIDPITINLVARGFSSGVYGNNYIECASGCPTSTVRKPTINNNNIKGATYFDGSISFRIRSGSDTKLNFIVKNIFNKDPVLVGVDRSTDLITFPQTSRPLFDTIGRVFRISLTTKF